MELHYKNLSLDNIVYVDDDGIQKIEEWRDIPDYQGYYQVSDLGRVKSLDRLVKNSLKTNKELKEKILKINQDIRGYYRAYLSKHNKVKTIKTHQLVAMAFLGHIPCGMKLVVDHINNNQIDNRLVNLQVISNRENSSKDKKNGTSKYVGVSWCKKNNKWTSKIWFKKLINIGYFNTEEEAYEHYIIALKSIKNGDEIKYNKKVKTSKYIGVSYCKKPNKWSAYYYDKIPKKIKIIGQFSTEEEACRAREEYIKNLNLK